MTDHQLVSCIMPTANRRTFVPRAIRTFLAQDYLESELVILDDGADAVADLIPQHPRIRYLRLPRQPSLGEKRNECVRASRGDLIMHWDDDDWSAPHRIRYQVEALRREDADLCGLRTMLFHEPATMQSWLYTYPERNRTWLAGGSLLYPRTLWQRHPFPNIQVGEDTRFVWAQAQARVVVLPDFKFYVATIHASNTSPKVCRGPYWSKYDGDLEKLMAGDPDSRDEEAPAQAQAAPEAKGGSKVKLNLGCCDACIPGFVNVDVVSGPGVDHVADLRNGWPWGENSVEHVRAWDIIEHLPDKIHTMNEIHRVLVPGGSAEIVVPTTDGPGAFQDPTHVSFWNRRSFLYYEAGNPYRERFARSYGVTAKFNVASEITTQTQDGPKLTIRLVAVKP